MEAATHPEPRFASPGIYTPTHLAERIISSKSALEGERKQVTVLFADLKGSMELLADRDPEEARRLLDPVLEHMIEAVHRYEGTVNQVMGDGIMALFGAPLAHEDHAVRACYAALRMQQTVGRYAEGVRRSEGVPIRIRIGLNSGEVVVRSIGSDLHMDYTAVGQTTHLAARMEQMADPGAILITAATLNLAEGYVEVKPLGPMPVRGLEGPVDVFELTGASAVRSRLHASAARGLTRFVGRDVELDLLRRALDQAGAGHGQMVAVVGEPGVGKSRLFYEFTRSHRTHGWLTVESGSVSYGKATPYLPVIDLLRAYFGIETRDDARRIREKVAGKVLMLDRALEPSLPAFQALLDLPVDDPSWHVLDPTQRRQRTLDAVKRLLLRESQVQPLLVVFEDLHWIDSETQAFLDGLIDGLPTARLLLLVNYRPEYHHGWGSKTYYTQVRLDALPAERVEEMLHALLGSDPALQPLEPMLMARTGGNPFFLEESVRTLVETKALAGERGAYRLAQPIHAVQVPASVQAVLAARIDRLPPDEKRLLLAAAVVGKDVPFVLLHAVADLGEEDLRRGLTHLQAAEFLYETSLFPELEHTFKHALTHEVAYGSVLHDRRRALHARIVGAIEALYADRLAEHVEGLAHHAFRGEDWDKAVGYGRQAGAKALGRSANREATAYFKQALAALARLPETRLTRELAVDLRLDLYNSLLPLDELRPLLEYLREAEALATALDDRHRLGWARLHICHLLVLIDETRRSVELGHDALAIAEAVGDRTMEAVAYLWVGCGYYALGEHRRGVDFLAKSLVALEDRAPGRSFTPSALPALLVRVTGRSYQSMFLGELGDFVRGAAIGDEALRFVEAMDHPWSLALACWQVGAFYCDKGELDRAVSLLERSVTVCREWGSTRTAAIAAIPLGYALALSGRAGEGAPLIEQGMQHLDAIGVTWRRGRRLTYLGEAYLLSGRQDDARATAERALELSRQRKERGFEAWALRLLAEIASQSVPPDVETAEDSYGQALALAGELEMRPLVAHCHLGLGRLHARTGKREQAREHLTTATAMLRDMDMQFWLEQAEAELKALG